MTYSSDFPSTKADQFPLRFPTGMRDRLKAEAAANARSINSEILVRLEQTFKADVVGSTPAIPDTGVADKSADTATLGMIDVDRMDALFALMSEINSSRAVKLTSSRLMHFAAVGYNELLSLVIDPHDDREVHAFLPAVRYRLERAIDASS
jgi:hypothetical protein